MINERKIEATTAKGMPKYSKVRKSVDESCQTKFTINNDSIMPQSRRSMNQTSGWGRVKRRLASHAVAGADQEGPSHLQREPYD
jgi:hypothetical protein